MSTKEQLISEAQIIEKQKKFRSNLPCPHCSFKSYINKKDYFVCPECEIEIPAERYFKECKEQALMDF